MKRRTNVSSALQYGGMSSSSSTVQAPQPDGARGFYKDATGVKWTVGVSVAINSLATLWLIAWATGGKQQMPLSAGESVLASAGIVLPDFLQSFIDWSGMAGVVLAAPLFLMTLILALQSTYRPFDTLHGALAIITTLVLFEATGSLVVYVWLIVTLALIAVTATISGWCARRNRAHHRDEEHRGYFGSRLPGRVFGEAVFALLPPIALVLSVLSVVGNAFTLHQPRRYGREFGRILQELQARDPNAANAVRLEALLRLAETESSSISRDTIAYILTADRAPSGAIGMPLRRRAE